jgi:hypothetical protein
LPCPTAIATRAAPPPTSFRCMPRCRVDAWMGRRRWTSTLDVYAGHWTLDAGWGLPPCMCMRCVHQNAVCDATVRYGSTAGRSGRYATLQVCLLCDRMIGFVSPRMAGDGGWGWS